MFERTQSSSFIFGQFPVARKLIINGGDIRPTGLLLPLKVKLRSHKFKCYISMNNGPITLKFCTEVQSQWNNACIG